MVGFADTLRGDGLARAQRALAALEGDQQQLDRARAWFDDSPPPYTSNRSGTSTLSQSPNPPSEEQRRYQERRLQLGRERVASQPYNQFEDHTRDEARRIWEADLHGGDIIPIGSDADTIAYENVKKCWVEQGIWNKKWNQFASGRWKHEEPLELDSESEASSEEEEEEEASAPFSFCPKEPQPKPRRPKSDEEKRQMAERRVIREREREASRPYHQFVYQISKERERIQDESTAREGTGVGLPDINTKAYENVKNTWTKRGIWNKRWGILPGMSWKHEEPLEEDTSEGLPTQPNPAEGRSHEVREAPLGNLFGRCVTNLSENGTSIRNLSPVGSNHGQASGDMNTSEQVPPADIVPAELENSVAEHLPSLSAPRPRTGKRVLRPTTGQALRPSKRKQSGQAEQPQPVASASLGPAYLSKVSKAAGKRKPVRQRRLNISQEVSSSDLPLSSDMDTAESQPSPDHATPRRSKRIKPPSPGIAKDPAKTASSDPSKRAVRSKPEQKVASNLTTKSSAKPQDVPKRQPTRTARGKVGKK